MQSYEEAPPPYPGTIPNVATNLVSSKGNYRGVPVYEIRSNDAPGCKFLIVIFLQFKIKTNFLDDRTAYQQGPIILTEPTVIQTRPAYVGRNPVHCICPQCHQQIVSRVEYVCINTMERIFIHFFST
jgi:hypothetical protein